MGRKCKVCAHPDIKAIDLALAARTPQTVLAKQYNLSIASLCRHRANMHVDIGEAVDVPIDPTREDTFNREREEAFSKKEEPPDDSRNLTNEKCRKKLGNYVAALESLIGRYIKSDDPQELIVCIRALKVASQVVGAVMHSNYINIEKGLMQIEAIPGEIIPNDEHRIALMLEELQTQLAQDSDAN